MQRGLALFAVLFVCAPALLPAAIDPAAAVESLRAAAAGPAEVITSPVTGRVVFFAVDGGPGVPIPDVAAASAAERAVSFLAAYGDAFGVGGASDVAVTASERDELGMDHVRVRQVRGGVPVTGGELAVHLRDGRVVAVNGRASVGLDDLDVAPAVPAAAALAAARDLASRSLVAPDAEPGEFSEPRLEILDRGLLEERSTPARLAWFVEATGEALREFIWVDARSGHVLLHFSQRPEAKNRAVYNANNGSSLPGVLVRSEGGPPTGDPDADHAYDYAGATYDYFFVQHGRDSYDNAGAQLKSSVHYCPSPAECPFANAFWNGVQMVYGSTYASADDVVAHELTHAVTERTAGLFYYMQSGALNESFSDIFGETVDLTDGVGNDTAGVRWQMGEDLPIGAIRNMMNPGPFGDPARVNDANFKCYYDGTDGGGVHSNSGVPNHAFALMVDGGSYNGRTVTAIGTTKAGKIQYRALTRYLLSGSGFRDDYYALYRSCMDLVGTAGITGANCAEVRDALDAVEMSLAPPCVPTQAAVPSLCPAGQAASTLSLTDFETFIGFTACPASGAPPNWCDEGPASMQGSFATSGVHSLWGDDTDHATDRWAAIAWPGTLPAGAKLQFNHAFGFEDDLTDNYDGGVVEYSTNGGTTWLDAAPLFAGGGMAYFGPLSNCCGNPLAGRNAFVGESWGYTATQLNLGSLAGQGFRIRFRIGTDTAVGDYGWFVDDLRLYQCAASPLLFADGFNSGNLGAWSSAFP